MSQSPLARSTRRPLTAFAHPPTRLSQATTSYDLNGSPTSSSSKSSNAYTTPSKGPTTRYRSVGNTPTTPTIHYSPYATSTPPQGLSRSSSIPFDMVGSAKAGRKAEEEARLREAEPVVESLEPKVRFVRRKGYLQRIKSFPRDSWELIQLHTPTSFLDLIPPSRSANPIAIILHILHFLLLAPLFASKDDSTSVLRNPRDHPYGVGNRWRYETEDQVKSRGIGGGWTNFTITLVLLALSAGNALYLFTRYRTYDMQLRSANDHISSPHASPIPAPKVEPQDVFTSSSSESQTPSTRVFRGLLWLLRGLWRWFRQVNNQPTWAIELTSKYSSTVLSSIGKPQTTYVPGLGAGADDRIQSLHLWDPPEFCLAFFCAYPPSSPILSYLFTPDHPFLSLPFFLLVSTLFSQLASTYSQLVKDRMVLSAEVMREYDRRFVYKRVFGGKVDRGVGTHEAEMVW
ncbi:hypothetical protein P7C73_g50, partial [Tremellales sp. Uapishka_1]